MLTLKHLKMKEAIEQATINYRTEILRDALDRRGIPRTAHAARVDPRQLQRAQPDARDRSTIASRGSSSRRFTSRPASSTTRFAICSMPPRISAKGVRPQLMWTDPTDIVSAALKQKERRLASHIGHARRRPRRSAGPCRFGPGRAGVRPASGKRREIFAGGQRNQNQQPLRAGLRGVVGEGSGQRADRGREGPTGQALVPRQRPSGGVSGSGLGLVDCQHLYRRQWRQPACGKPRAEPRHDDVAAAADGVRR